MNKVRKTKNAIRITAKERRFKKYAKTLEKIVNTDPVIRAEIDRAMREFTGCWVDQMISGQRCTHDPKLKHVNYWDH
jgi:hypothetical protein